MIVDGKVTNGLKSHLLLINDALGTYYVQVVGTK